MTTTGPAMASPAMSTASTCLVSVRLCARDQPAVAHPRGENSERDRSQDRGGGLRVPRDHARPGRRGVASLKARYLALGTHLPQQDGSDIDVVVVFGLAARLGKITVDDDVVQSVFEMGVDLRHEPMGVDDVQGHAHHHVDGRDEQGGDDGHTGGMRQVRPGSTDL